MQLSDLVKKYIEIAFGNQRSAEAFISELESSDSLPSGGSTGQLLTKQSNNDGDAIWANPPTGTIPSGGTTGEALIKNSNADGDISWGQPTISGSFNSLAYFDSSGDLISLPNWSVTSWNGVNSNLTLQPNGTSGNQFIHSYGSAIDPLVDSPDQAYTQYNLSLQLDPNNTGRQLGTNSTGATILNMGFNHIGKSNTGVLTYLNMNSTIGNGTDPISIGGFTFNTGFANFAAGVTLRNGLQGWTFQPSVNALSVLHSTYYATPFADFSQINAPMSGSHSHNSFNSTPTIVTMNSGAYYSGVNVAPTITTLASGANANGVNVQPNVTGGAGNFNGINSSVANVNSTGLVSALSLLAGSTDKFAILSDGRSNLGVALSLSSSLGQISGHNMGGSITIPNNTSITGTDVIFSNLGGQINLGNASSSFVGSGLVDITQVGFVGQIIGQGTANNINFLLAGFSAAHDGHIDSVNCVLAAAVPGGGTGTIGELVGFKFDSPLGAVAGTTWAIRSFYSGAESFLPRIIVGTGSSTFKVTNASVGIEIDSTTQAMLNARMTETQRDALTAVDGMQIYNLTAQKLQVRAAGAWVNLH